MRCYDGCWDSEAKAIFAEQDFLEQELKKLNSDARCTYFPMETKYLIFVGFHSIGKMHTNKTDTLVAGINLLK